jgi:uncharacterized membrane protein
MSSLTVTAGRVATLAAPVSPPAGDTATPGGGVIGAAATIGVIAAGAALFEAALIPGIVIGGAAVLVPRYLPKLRDRVKPWRKLMKLSPASLRPMSESRAAGAGASIKEAIFKTVTYRLVVTSLDFSFNYMVLGELAAAAGLSAFSLVAGPVFYFAHEAAWSHWGPALGFASEGRPFAPPALPAPGDPPPSTSARPGFTINRALAKTITYRTFATAMEFTTNYIVAGDVVTAATLSAFGFVIGPFVYYAHEVAWERFASPAKRTDGSDADAPTWAGSGLRGAAGAL